LSDALKDRVLGAMELYDEGKVEKFLLSGDHGTKEYDEVNAMKNFLLNKGINGDDIFLDHAGFDTYDSIYRAKNIFGVKDCVIVTQAFHLARAVYVARKMGMDAYGLVAHRQEIKFIGYYELREMVARSKSFFDVLFNVSSKYLGEKISLEGSGKVTWD
jgi:vancomycin permeability regulator SanA